MSRAVHKLRASLRPIVLQQTPVTGTDSTNPYSVSLDVGAQNSSKVCYVCTQWEESGGDDVTGITVGGLTATQIGSIVTQGVSHTAWWAVRVPNLSGSQTVAATVSGALSGELHFTLISLLHVKDPFNPTFSGSVTGTAGTITVSSVTAERGGYVMAGAMNNQGSSTTTWTGLTERFTDQTGSVYTGADDGYPDGARSAADVSIQWSNPPNSGGTLFVISVR